MPETKTSVKAGVKTPVADPVSAENGKVLVEKPESGSFQASGLKESGVSENGGNLSEKAQELSSRQVVEKKEPFATLELSSNATKTAGNILSGSGESPSAGKGDPLFSDSFRAIHGGVGEVSVTEKGEKGQKELPDGLKVSTGVVSSGLEPESQSSKSNTEQREGQAESEKSNQFQGKIPHNFSEKLESVSGEDTQAPPKTYTISDNGNTIVAPDKRERTAETVRGEQRFRSVVQDRGVPFEKWPIGS